MEKTLQESKTVWFGLAVAVLPLLDWVTESGVIASNPQMVSFVGAAIIILRKLTSSPLAFKVKK